ncbi:hypothetical protein [Tenacibaculum sp. MAR_2009_124]|uniref:hypothetical protein n=1 Tax=Tenacibaculum sp. MAR_2009_124 TaxID=1250059 RepID=UPI000B87AE7F|nr:hypothetical protein [Tenacibaculum sp. MAR_2009_124]
MKKRTYITIIILSLFLSTCKDSKKMEARVMKIGKELVMMETKGDFRSNENFLVNDVVNVGKSLFNLIQTLKPFDNVSFNVEKGDIPYGNGSADYTLEILKQELNLKVRLKYDSNYDRFHILGFTCK